MRCPASRFVIPGSEIDRLFARFLRRGDSGALAALFDATAEELLRVASYLAGDRHAAEDLVQSTFLVAIEDARSHDPGRPVLPWILGILANRARELRRMRAKAADLESAARHLRVLEAADPADAAARAEFARELAVALKALPSPYGEVLALHLHNGLSAKEIAESLRRPAGTVRTQVMRGMEMLRAALPAGFATGALIMAVPGSSLAAVRATVLGKLAAQPAPFAGAAAFSGLLGGALLMKTVLLAGAAALAALAFICWPSSGGEASEARPGSRPSAGLAPRSREAAMSRGLAELKATSAPEGQLRSEIANAPPPGHGALRIEVVWADDGAPATRLPVRYAPRLGEEKHGEWKETCTDEQGIVESGPLLAGGYSVRACSTLETLAVEPGRTTRATLRARPGHAFTGVVVDAKGAPVGGALVRTVSHQDLVLATSRADGTVAWRGEHISDIWAQKDGFTPSRRLQVAPYQGTPAHVRFVLGAPGVRIEGQVVDAHGAPAADADVLISVDEVQDQPILADGTRALSAPPIVLRADRAGRFATDCVPPGDHWLGARAPGNAPTFVKITVPAPPDRPLVVRLGEGATVHGVVRDDAGQPVAAGIEAHGPNTQAMGLWPLSIVVLFQGDSTKADEQGRYILRYLLPSAELSFQVTADGTADLFHRTSLAAGEDREWNPVLARTGAVSGRVVDAADRGMAGWGICVQPSWGPPRRIGSWTYSDTEGHFIVTGLAPGNHTFWALPPDARGAARTIRWGLAGAPTGEKNLVLHTRWSSEQTCAITGRVLEASDGRPVAQASLRVWPKTHAWDMNHEEKLEGGDASFRIAPLPADAYRIDVSSPGHGRLSFEKSVAAGQTLDLGALLLARVGTVTASLLLPPGIRREDVLLRLGDERRAFWATGFTATAEGDRSPGFAPGPAWLEAWGPSIVRAEQAITVVPGADVKVKLALERALKARIVFVQPEPRSEHWTDWTTVSIRDTAGAESEHSFQVDGGETFEWTRGFAPGAYRLSATLFRSERMQAEAQVVVPRPTDGGAQPSVDVRLVFTASTKR